MIREEEEIYQQIYEANNYILQGKSKYPGLTNDEKILSSQFITKILKEKE